MTPAPPSHSRWVTVSDSGGWQCHHGPAVSVGWCQLSTVPTRVSPVGGMAVPELPCPCSQLRSLCYNNCSLALPLPGQLLHFEFPSLGMGAGVSTRPSFTPKGLRYSHHFRLSLCGHQVRTVWANTWEYTQGAGTGTQVQTWAHVCMVGTQESGHTWAGGHGNMHEDIGTHLGRHTRAYTAGHRNRHACVGTRGLMGGW